ncbi:hypothetical protein RIF29_24646 [Crotalaria pallida]|uniref:Uncharacterized protein n=1 Tax=Crotalaria pallida TaxID=3830 RepID=A0AAN9EK33_CROPI
MTDAASYPTNDQKERSNKKVKPNEETVAEEVDMVENQDQVKNSMSTDEENCRLSYREVVMSMVGFQPSPKEIIQIVQEELCPMVSEEMALDNSEEFNKDGQWRWDILNEIVPASLAPLIAAIVPPAIVSGSDAITWAHENSGEFSIASAVSILHDSSAQNQSQAASLLFRSVWNWHGPQRVRALIHIYG